MLKCLNEKVRCCCARYIFILLIVFLIKDMKDQKIICMCIEWGKRVVFYLHIDFVIFN